MTADEHDPDLDESARKAARYYGNAISILIIVLLAFRFGGRWLDRAASWAAEGDPNAMIAGDSPAAMRQLMAGVRAAGADTGSARRLLNGYDTASAPSRLAVTLPAQMLPDSMYSALVAMRYRQSASGFLCALRTDMNRTALAGSSEPAWLIYDLGYALGLQMRGAKSVVREPSGTDFVAYVKTLRATGDSALDRALDDIGAGRALDAAENCAFTLATYRLAAERPGEMAGHRSMLDFRRYMDYASAEPAAPLR